MLPKEHARQPTPEAIRTGLGRITASPGFANADRMRRFIGYIVNKTIEGEAETLKEYPIGVEVFDRVDFDPRIDTIVRVEARRLRKKLQEYYVSDGLLDPVVISLPSGSYVPLFDIREATAEPVSMPARWSGWVFNRWVLVASGILMIVAVIFSFVILRGMRSTPGTMPIASVAVLPFLDLSAAKDQEYVCDGLAEEMVNALSAIPNLRVAARTSSFRYKGKSDDARRIGADLGVEHIVEGSIRSDGRHLRITAQLIRANDGYHIWSREFDREFTEIFAVEEELARAVATSVGAELAAGRVAVRTNNPEAYRLYLQGRQYWRHFQPSSTPAAVSHFEQAIALDPSFAPAYAGLGDAYEQMSLHGASPSVFTKKARNAASTALHLAPNSAEAETTLGSISAEYDWDWKECERHYRRAIDDDANYINAHWLLATTCLAPQGRLDEALVEARRAVRLDPLSPLTHTMVGAVLWYRREYGPALIELDQALSLDPSYFQASLFKTFVYLSEGRVDLAAAFSGPSEWQLYIQAKLGDTTGVRAEIERRIAESRDPIAIAGGFAGLGEPYNALSWLEKAADARVGRMIWIHFQAPFDSLHGTIRYKAIRDRMHLT